MAEQDKSTKPDNPTEEHVITIGRYTLRRLARGEQVDLSMSNGCRVVLIDASDYPRELANLEPPNGE